MEFDDSSMISTPPEKEPVMEYSLMLTTLSGETFQVSLSVAKFDRFEDLEDQVMDYLVSVTDLKVFGCLEDPIWDKLQRGMEYTIVFRNCSVILPSQAELEDCPTHHIPLAVHVPMNPERSVPEGAFAGVPRLRHASVESGIRSIEAEAWQNCRQLRVVKLPATVRTPCGHGAQVIVEGREKQSDGGEKNKDHKYNPKTTTEGAQAKSPPSCSLSSVLGETGETKKSVQKEA